MYELNIKMIGHRGHREKKNKEIKKPENKLQALSFRFNHGLFAFTFNAFAVLCALCGNIFSNLSCFFHKN